MPPAPQTNQPINFGALNLQPQGQPIVPSPPPAAPTPQAQLPAATPTGQLDEASRSKLDGIVQQMQANKETDANIQAVVDDFKQKYSQPTTPSKPTLGDVGSGLASAFGSAFGQVKDAASAGINEVKSGFSDAQTSNDPISPPLKIGAGAINTIASPLAPIFKPLGDAVQFAGDTIANAKPVQDFAMSPVGGVASKVAEDVGNAATIAGGIAGGVKPAEALPGAVSRTGDSISSALPSPFKTTSELKADATANINKGLSNTGKASATGILSKDSNRLAGFETLYNLTKDQPITRPDGTSFQFDPTHITDPHDVISAFVQAKNQLWAKVQAGLDRGSSIKPNYAPVISKLQDVLDNSASKSLKAHAASRLEEVKQLATQGVQGAQRYLQEEINPRIGAAISGASDAPALKLDAELAHGINGSLDNGLSQVKDAGIREYKDQYSSLKSIEPDLVKMTQTVLRQKGRGLPQYINDFGNLDILDAALSHNPGLFIARGIGKKVIAKVLDTQRDPLDHLSRAFTAIDGYMRGAKPLQEAPTLALPPGRPGPVSQIPSAAPINLPAQGESSARTTFPPLLPGNQ